MPIVATTERECATLLATCVIASVWLFNGLYCKVLLQVPRHQQIVTRILGETWANELTILIGIGEMILAIWIVSGLYKSFCFMLQIVLIVTMNLLEFTLAPDLLLHGKLNLIFSLLFCSFLFFTAFILPNRK